METQSLAASLPKIARSAQVEFASASAAPSKNQEVAEAVTASKPTAEQAQQAVDDINLVVQVFNKNVEFSVDKETGIDVVKVVEKDSKEVIRQLPLDAVISFARTLETLQGLLVRQTV